MKTAASTLRYGIVSAIVLLLAGTAGGYWFGYHRTQAPMASAETGRKVLYWHDPMVPNARFDKPGKSPFMDMQLVPVYADEAVGDAGVQVSANVSQSLGIRLGKVEKATLRSRLKAVGAVAYNDQLQEVVAARVEGVVKRLHVHAPLEGVVRGQPLAEITAPSWIEAQHEYLALLDAKSDAARGLLTAARERLRVLGLPEEAIQRIESERKVVGTTTLTASMDGVLSEIGVREGSAVMPGTPLFRINGLGSVWVNARVSEVQLAQASVGSAVDATALAWPSMKFQGRVVAVLPQVDTETRTVTARVLLDNRERKLSPGMFVSLELASPAAQVQLVVPDEAVIVTGERNVVITADAKGRFGVVNVTTGASQEGRTVVFAGLSEGQAVVLSGQFLIDSEAGLKSTLDRLGATGNDGTGMIAEITSESMTHRAEGTIKSVSASDITITHGPVPSLNWPDMTMGFQLPSSGVPRDLKAGDHVSFTFKEADGVYHIESITKPAHDAAMGHDP